MKKLIYVSFREQKLIDDLTLPTGISHKPNEKELKELSKRAKNLDRELIFRIILEKLMNYENMNDNKNIKTLIVK